MPASKGISCPKCGAWTTMLESRRDSNNAYVRYRNYECGNLHRFSSTVIETITGFAPDREVKEISRGKYEKKYQKSR